MSLFDEIPGLAAAVDRESAVRELSLLDTIILCGIPCRQLSIRTHTLLTGMKSPVLVRVTAPKWEDLAVYLWMHCLEYEAGNEKRRQRWVRRNVSPLVKAGRYAQALGEIDLHIENTFMDSPGAGRYDGKQYFLGSAALVDSVAAEYGWTDDYIMALPIGRLFQYQRAMRRRYDPKAPLSNPSDRLLSQYMIERMRQAQPTN